jgi:dolichol-phosphate mannosyltransferase
MSPALQHKIAVVIPCYRVKNHIKNVVAAIPDYVERIYCVDDACPDGSGDFIRV